MHRAWLVAFLLLIVAPISPLAAQEPLASLQFTSGATKDAAAAQIMAAVADEGLVTLQTSDGVITFGTPANKYQQIIFRANLIPADSGTRIVLTGTIREVDVLAAAAGDSDVMPGKPLTSKRRKEWARLERIAKAAGWAP